MTSLPQAKALAQMSSDTPSEIASRNPDGIKYDFVKSYIMALEYLYQNETSRKAAPVIGPKNIDNLNVLAKEQDRLISANVNLRIARNLLERFLKGNNGLIVKVIEIFSAYSDKQVELNNRERMVISVVLKSALLKNLKDFDYKWYSDNVEKIANERRESSMQLLESSLMVPKVLISQDYDNSGHFYKLGITKEERRNLIRRMRIFSDENFKGEVRSGQTFLEASVSAIREMLEDTTWSAQEDLHT